MTSSDNIDLLKPSISGPDDLSHVPYNLRTQVRSNSAQASIADTRRGEASHHGYWGLMYYTIGSTVVVSSD